MKLRKLEYKIHDSDFGYKWVVGTAINYKKCRLCIRKIGRISWYVDHFDSGLHVTVVFASTEKEAAKKAVAFIKEKISDGSYATAINRANEKMEMVAQ